MTTPEQAAKDVKKKADEASKKLLQTQQKVLKKMQAEKQPAKIYNTDK